jgi:uncharacterized membrane protein
MESCLSVLVIVEFIADKLPNTPRRKALPGFRRPFVTGRFSK